MYVRLGITALLFMMINAVFFGAGAVLVLATPLEIMALQLMPIVVVAAPALALPVSWWLAPRLRARYWRNCRRDGIADRALDALS